MVRSTFLTLLIHTCDIQRLLPAPASSATYGHQSLTAFEPQTVAAQVRCRLRSLSAPEMSGSGQVGTIVATHLLYLAWNTLPDGMTWQFGPTRFQIANVRRAVIGTLIDPGPFDIEEVIDAAGEGHHAQIRLKRVG